MEYVVQSTLSTLTGLAVIGVWLLIGYYATRPFCSLSGGPFPLRATTAMGIIGGLVTALLLVFVTLMVGFADEDDEASDW